MCPEVWVGKFTLLTRFKLSRKSRKVIVSGLSGLSMCILKSPSRIGLAWLVTNILSKNVGKSFTETNNTTIRNPVNCIEVDWHLVYGDVK